MNLRGAFILGLVCNYFRDQEIWQSFLISLALLEIYAPFLFFQIHMRRAVARGYSYIHSYKCPCAFLCRAPDQTKNDTDLQFVTLTPLTITKTDFWFFEKMTKSC